MNVFWWSAHVTILHHDIHFGNLIVYPYTENWNWNRCWYHIIMFTLTLLWFTHWKLVMISGLGQHGSRLCFATFKTLRPRKNGRHFADNIFKCIFLNGNVWIPIKISLKFVPQGPINNIPALVQIMAWRRPGDKPLSGPMMVRIPTHLCVTRPQWVKAPTQYLSFDVFFDL